MRAKNANEKRRIVKDCFSDKRKFNLDGPNGFQYYWHDLENELKYFSESSSA